MTHLLLLIHHSAMNECYHSRQVFYSSILFTLEFFSQEVGSFSRNHNQGWEFRSLGVHGIWWLSGVAEHWEGTDLRV